MIAFVMRITFIGRLSRALLVLLDGFYLLGFLKGKEKVLLQERFLIRISYAMDFLAALASSVPYPPHREMTIEIQRPLI